MLRVLSCRTPAASSPALAATRRLATIRRLGTDDPRSSQVVVHNGVVMLTGQVDATGKTVAEQTSNCLAKVDALLESAGTDKSRLLTAAIWLKHIEQDFAEMNAVWNAWVDPENKPTRYCVEVRGASAALCSNGTFVQGAQSWSRNQAKMASRS